MAGGKDPEAAATVGARRARHPRGVVGKNPVAGVTVRARTTSRCGRVAGMRTPADRDPDPTENKRASFGTPFLLRPVAVNRELPDSSAWCGCLGGDQHHAVGSVR